MKISNFLIKFITALLIISVILLAILSVMYVKSSYIDDNDFFSENPLEKIFTKEDGKETIKTKTIKSGLSTAISATTGKKVDVDEYIKENMSEDDAKFINKMLDEKVDIETVTEIAQSYVEEGTISKETIKELDNKLTDEEKDKVMELAEEYGEDFLEYIKE